jgi:pimeloyl-ACP methyl ester carboxylesterase
VPILAVAVVALLAAGVLYQRVGTIRHRRRFAPPGVLVRIHGHRLHLSCRGRGSPAVFLESAIAGSSLSWTKVDSHVARFTRVCSYDRAGLGWSDAPSSPRTFERIVDDLSAVIDHVAGDRCILVGHSFGSFVVRAYAMRRPERVVGLVLVDPAMEWLTMTPARARLLAGGQHLSRIGALLAHIGVVRVCLALLSGGAPGVPRRFVKVFGPTAARTLERLVGEVRKLPVELHPVVQSIWCQPKCFRAMGAHMLTLHRDAALIAAVMPPANIPLVVISSADQPPERLEAHRTLAAQSRHGRHVIATQGAHWVQFDQPELVVEAARDLVLSWRQHYE